MINNIFTAITDIFNNREISIAIWVIILFIFISIKQPNFYKNIFNVIVSFFRLSKYFLIMFLYILISVFALYKLSIWNIGFIKITIFWIFGWAIIMFINSVKIENEKGYLKKIIFEIIGLTVFISFMSNLYNFSLWLELILIPFIALLAGMSAVASFDKKYNPIGKFTNNILFIFGIIVLGVSLYKTIIYFNNLATINTFKEFIIPILLSFIFIPFVYISSLYSRWQLKNTLNKNLKHNINLNKHYE